MRYINLALGFCICLGLAGAQSATQQAIAALAVRGDVSTPFTLTSEDLARMPVQTVSVKEEDGSVASYRGVALRDVLQRAGVPFGKLMRGNALAGYVVAKARDGYQVVFSLGELDESFGNQSILVADQVNGKPLFDYQGPFRLVCPNDKAGARSVRMLESLEVVKLKK